MVCLEEDVGMFVNVWVTEGGFLKASEIIGDVVKEMGSEGAYLLRVVETIDVDY